MKSIVRSCARLQPLRQTTAFLAAQRYEGYSPPITPTPIAPKKPKATSRPGQGPLKAPSSIDLTSLLSHVPEERGAHGELSTAELDRKVEEWARLNPKKLEELMMRFEQQEDLSSRVLEEDSVHQMDVSLTPRQQGGVRVFWKKVDVAESATMPGWYSITLDGRPVKAFESSTVLLLPTEALAYSCAVEYAQQEGFLNKLLMPLTDICSGALHISPQLIQPRIEYLLSFYRNDNIFFRSTTIAAQQDKDIQPVSDWFSKTYGLQVPRILGLGDPHITPAMTEMMREALLSLNLNTYQLLCFCVMAQFTSSLILPLALFHSAVDLPTVIRINGAEERYNVEKLAMIEGYHDIREADVMTKLAACATVWRLTSDVSFSKSLEAPRAAKLIE